MDKPNAVLAHQAGQLKIANKRGWISLAILDGRGEVEAEIRIPSRYAKHLCRALRSQSPLEFEPEGDEEISVSRELRGMRVSGQRGSCVLSAHQAFQVADYLGQYY